MKICPKCSLSKPLSDFHKSSASPSGYQGRCKDCVSAYGKARYESIKPALQPNECNLCRRVLTSNDFRAHQRTCKSCYRLKTQSTKYNIDPSTLPKSCQLCGSVERLCIDHDHSCCAGARSCGKCVRGVLCHKCNAGLGQFNDDPELMYRAIQYLSPATSVWTAAITSTGLGINVDV